MTRTPVQASGSEIDEMTSPLIRACRAVYADFMPAEASADLAAARTARLLATVLEQRSAARLSIGTGTLLIRKLTKSLTAQIEAREEFAYAHKIAAEMPAEFGLEPSAYGDVVPCPPDDKKRLEGADDNVIRLSA